MTLTPAGRFVTACSALTVLLLAVAVIPHLTVAQLVAAVVTVPTVGLLAAMGVAR